MDRTFADRFAGESLDVLESILSHSRDCIKLLNARGELEYLSASANDALEIDEPAQLLGKVWRNLWPENERAALDEAIATAWSGTSARFRGKMPSDDGTPRHWEVTISPVRGGDGQVTHLLAVSTNVTAQWESVERGRERLEQAEDRASFASVISRELRHRLKNQLAVVNAVAKLLARHSTSARELTLKLEEKLIAMGRAQDLLSIERDGPLTASQAVVEVVEASGAGDRISVRGIPAAILPEESVQQLALLLGELQTNALKHGALRNDRGDVYLSGRRDEEVMSLLWEEDCHQAVSPASAGNGGFQLIRRLGAAGGKQPSIVWQPTGIAVEFHVRVVPDA